MPRYASPLQWGRISEGPKGGVWRHHGSGQGFHSLYIECQPWGFESCLNPSNESYGAPDVATFYLSNRKRNLTDIISRR